MKKYSRADYFKALFNEGEQLCLAWKEKDVNIFPLSRAIKAPYCQWISLNPIDGHKDRNPTKYYHSADKPRRADDNVTSFRNILVEFDEIPLEDQGEIMDKLKLPFTTAVYSGKKSVHFIIRLKKEQEFSSIEDYKLFVDAFYKTILFYGYKVDKQCKNPSRLTRSPDFNREGVNQDLIYVGEPVDLQVLENFVGTSLNELKTLKNEINLTDDFDNNLQLSAFTMDLLMFGVQEGGRNNAIFRAACDMFKAGYDSATIEHKLLPVSTLSYDEVIRTIKNAEAQISKNKA